MKTRIYLVMLALVFCSGVAKAQQGVYIGPNFVYSMTTLIDRERWGDVDYSYKYTSGYTAGLVGGFNVSETFGIQTELNYQWTGIRTKQDVGGTEFEKRFNLQYIQIPVLFKYMSPSSPVKFSLSGGPYIGFNTGAKIKQDGGPAITVVTAQGTTENNLPVYQNFPANLHRPSKCVDYRGNYRTDPVTQVPVPIVTTSTTSAQTINQGASERKVTEEVRNVDVGVMLNIGAEFVLNEQFNWGIGARGIYGFVNVNKPDYMLTEFGGAPERLGNAQVGIYTNLQYFIMRY